MLGDYKQCSLFALPYSSELPEIPKGRLLATSAGTGQPVYWEYATWKLARSAHSNRLAPGTSVENSPATASYARPA